MRKPPPLSQQAQLLKPPPDSAHPPRNGPGNKNQAFIEARHYVREREADSMSFQEDCRAGQEAFKQAQLKCTSLEQQFETWQSHHLLYTHLQQPTEQAHQDVGIHKLALPRFRKLP